MGSISKHREIIEENRISKVPPSLTSHIISFLPVKDAVRTSVLSTYWHQQWTSLPGLHFLLVPCCLLSCTNLEVLDIVGEFLPKVVPTSTSLVSLNILYLDEVRFLDDESFSRLISSCPLLEELNLLGYSGTYLQIINISSHSLQKLVIWFDDLFLDEVCSRSIVLNTPSLRYLDYGDNCIPNSYSLGKLHYLERAQVCMKPYMQLNLVCKPISDLALGISNVRILHISKCSFEALGSSLFQLPMFPRLISLKIEVLTNVGWRVLRAFLESSPQLATLIFGFGGVVTDHFFISSDHIEESYATQASVPHCVLFNLKLIEVNDFVGLEMELEMLSYFLEQVDDKS